MASRAQSETLGYVFVFVLVLSAMGVVTVVGVSGLQDARDAERLNNVEMAFETLEENIDDLVSQRVPGQATEINLADARLYHGEPVTWTVNGTAVGNPNRNFSYAVTVDPIVYETESDSGTKILYSSGAVFRQQRSGTVVQSDHDFLLTPNRTNLLFVETRQGPTSGGIGGTTTAHIRTLRAGTELYQANRTAYDLTISVESPRAQAWADSLDRQPGTSCSLPSPTRASCSLTTERVYVSVARVDVIFS